MDKFLWIGGLFNPDNKDYYVEKGHKIMSSYKSQKNIFDGIEKSCDVGLDSINSMRIDPYPIVKLFHVKKEIWSHNKVNTDISVPYFNIKFLSVLFRTISLIREAKIWARKNKNNRVFIFCFGMTSPFMKACISISRIVKKTRLIMINPDLPEFMEKNPTRIKKMLKKIDQKWIYKNIHKFSKQVLYSEHMANYLNLKNNSWIVMEGLVSADDILHIDKVKSDKTVIMYAGVVGKMYGIDKLIDSMEFLGKNYELRIYGSGDLEQFVRSKAQIDDRIIFFGYCGDKEKLLHEEKNADILISLINPNDEVSNYCFPSKIFEYMLSGNIVISTKIGGIPKEYFDYIFPLDDVSPHSIANKILEVEDLSKEQKSMIGKKEVDFIINNKNNLVQGKRIFDFIYE